MNRRGKRVLEVVSFETGEVVRAFDVSGKSDRHIDRLEAGLLCQMAKDKFFTRLGAPTESEAKR